MSSRRDIVIGLALLARSLVACDFALSADIAGARLLQEESVSAPGECGLLTRRRSGRGLSNDPGRSRPPVTPLPAAPYETIPTEA
jgi:hypothetical protein